MGQITQNLGKKITAKKYKAKNQCSFSSQSCMGMDVEKIQWLKLGFQSLKSTSVEKNRKSIGMIKKIVFILPKNIIQI